MKITEEALFQSSALREGYMDKTDVLDKVKELVFLPSTDLVTVQQVADFYEVNGKTIEKLIERNKDELITDGYLVLRGGEYRKFATDILSGTNYYNPKARSLAIFPRRAVLRVGMLLRDSKVAKQVRTYLLDVEEVAPHRALMNDLISASGYQPRYYNEGEYIWYVAHDIYKSIGYKSAQALVNRIARPDQVKIKRINNKDMLCIREDAIILKMTRSKNEEHKDLLTKYGIQVGIEYSETTVKRHIKRSFAGFKIEDEKQVSWINTIIRPDLFFPDFNIAVEIDEFGHKQYDRNKEIARQAYINNVLGWKLVRDNPFRQGFNPGDMVNSILSLMIEIKGDQLYNYFNKEIADKTRESLIFYPDKEIV